MTDALITTSGETAMADQDVCVAVGEDLTRHYPGHLWSVGCDHRAGTIVIDLPYQKPAHLRNFAYLLHIPTILGPGGQAAVMRAGGELLERFGLARGAATDESGLLAKENGLIVDDAVTHSRGSKV